MSDHSHQFICADCNIDVVRWGGDVSDDLCYNCMFIRRVCDTSEQKAAMRKVLGCEWMDRDAKEN